MLAQEKSTDTSLTKSISPEDNTNNNENAPKKEEEELDKSPETLVESN